MHAGVDALPRDDVLARILHLVLPRVSDRRRPEQALLLTEAVLRGYVC
eukprot:SAG11_NODE_34584_length_271_cov_0.598837_2_plen_47_part_01